MNSKVKTGLDAFAQYRDLLAAKPGRMVVSGVPDGVDAMAIAEIAARGPVLHIARDDQRLAELSAAIRFFAPGLPIVQLPAWDVVPYDRVAPNASIVARRIATLAALSDSSRDEVSPLIVLTTVNAALQRLPAREWIAGSTLRLKTGGVVPMSQIATRLDAMGYTRVGSVMEPGEYAVRGGILDLYPPGSDDPLRLDFFGDSLETIRAFDPETQRSAGRMTEFTLLPMSEAPLDAEARTRFRQRYVELFGPSRGEDPLYESVSAGTRYQGLEHWLPLFHERLETIFDYLPDAIVSFDPLSDDAHTKRLEQIADHYEAREQALERRAFGAAPYNPVPAEMAFLTEADWNAALAKRKVRAFTPFEEAGAEGAPVVSLAGRRGRSFAMEREDEKANVFDAAVAHVRRLVGSGRRVLVASWTPGARERLQTLLKDHGLDRAAGVENWRDAEELPPDGVGFAVLGLEAGFETETLAIVAEQDILGDRLVRRRARHKRGVDVLTEAASLQAGDLVVHAEHGVGRFEGLTTIEAAGAPHDCLELFYQGGSKLYLPVENIELLTRYGADAENVVLDKLGGVAWQSRKARLKKRIRDMAEKLIKVAALRELKRAPIMTPPDGAYDEFSARFPFEETDDQLTSLDAVLDDLASGRPMDRLICGDVGFGKTEVALRAAFVAVMSGKQVAVVVPTTLLSRQHFATFMERFRGLPVRIAQASRLVPAAELAQAKKDIADGKVDIVIGTHALLGNAIEFSDLGLLVIDEEQHFGVKHKERLKQLREEVHVLTLTATPIPRTLQLALSGVREMSVIATPPVDRLAVRTYVTPFDPVILREALLRERYRGGQSFFVVPRISDLDDSAAFLAEHLPELKVARAHGQMAPTQLEDVMTAFYDRQFDVLLSTTIVESGLDVPSANTLVVHRADMFGLAQLYQLRGRVGRSKIRAYSYFTLPADKRLTAGAEQRLKVLQSLDTLGAGFTLASHDLDIRGAGNLLGEEQSGHIREVGFELYQSMLEEAITALRGGELGEIEDQWSPRIAIGAAVLLPETYVADLGVRLGLYRRLSALADADSIGEFGAELADRFGPLPIEVKQLLEVVEIKALCRRANVESIDAGPRGAVVAFRNKSFPNAEGLIGFIRREGDRIRLQPDHKIVYKADWDEAEDRLAGARDLVRQLADIAEAVRAAA